MLSPISTLEESDKHGIEICAYRTYRVLLCNHGNTLVGSLKPCQREM